MFDWLTSHKLPLGSWLQVGVDFLNDHASFVFDAISRYLSLAVDGMTHLLLAIPALIIVAFVAVFAYALHRSTPESSRGDRLDGLAQEVKDAAAPLLSILDLAQLAAVDADADEDTTGSDPGPDPARDPDADPGSR